jgi:hypothetical protein
MAIRDGCLRFGFYVLHPTLMLFVIGNEIFAIDIIVACSSFQGAWCAVCAADVCLVVPFRSVYFTVLYFE